MTRGRFREVEGLSQRQHSKWQYQGWPLIMTLGSVGPRSAVAGWAGGRTTGWNPGKRYIIASAAVTSQTAVPGRMRLPRGLWVWNRDHSFSSRAASPQVEFQISHEHFVGKSVITSGGAT